MVFSRNDGGGDYIAGVAPTALVDALFTATFSLNHALAAPPYPKLIKKATLGNGEKVPSRAITGPFFLLSQQLRFFFFSMLAISLYIKCFEILKD